MAVPFVAAGSYEPSGSRSHGFFMHHMTLGIVLRFGPHLTPIFHIRSFWNPSPPVCGASALRSAEVVWIYWPGDLADHLHDPRFIPPHLGGRSEAGWSRRRGDGHQRATMVAKELVKSGPLHIHVLLSWSFPVHLLIPGLWSPTGYPKRPLGRSCLNAQALRLGMGVARMFDPDIWDCYYRGLEVLWSKGTLKLIARVAARGSIVAAHGMSFWPRGAGWTKTGSLFPAKLDQPIESNRMVAGTRFFRPPKHRRFAPRGVLDSR